MNGKVGKILLVADDRTLGQGMAQIAASLEQEVVVVDEARQALALIDADPFTLILFAARLPDMTAQEFLSRVKNADDVDSVATIAIGDSDRSMELEQCLEAGADDFLITPISTGLLRARVRFVLEQKRLRQKQRESSLQNPELL